MLLEVLLAVAIMAIGMISLANGLNSRVKASNQLNRTAALQLGLESVIREVSYKPLDEMQYNTVDQVTGISYRTEVIETAYTLESGDELEDIIILKVVGEWEEGGQMVEKSAQIHLYKPE